ncbi:beta-galactosidase [Flavobacterium gawalongense]|uniref:Beta-galactosidase n=1 Tax=Flavobacterium gawalongense TaxID=2594432 RepID=A0A553BMN0_9FLAO|nr:beta-galactosidase [Flavobacterium gawalongense]TRX01863.1 beta-galactosidase [Flavobacterium gawalongense]TRX06317.1 beta-galactosidase [Flavobacterium gawalongense]TRX09507.1 beta-galactosidase [Flavobacterium gawalongense]TRX10674.1 beta-galactosidase [Flavobacterium gawalongense]TRX27874.1 beta-galactosidase [Flavobacterium gawalongense]
MKTIRFLLLFALFPYYINAQSFVPDNILYGVAYYHEYMPSERLDKDVKMMKEAGISVVRIGESTWSLYEPREGEFEFAWLDRIIDKFHEAGIKVILGTPTYSIPAWLWHKHPEVLIDFKNGAKAKYGIRQNMDITNPTYLFYSERIIRKMMEHFTSHPGIIGYQVDNETTSRGVNNYDFQVSFVNYLKKKYKTPQNLNKIWGLNYWGMTIDSWEEVPPRDGVTNTGYKLDWARFNRIAVADFLKWQSGIVQEYKRKDQFITHCFMPSVQDVDQLESAAKMDVMGVNIYHDVQDKLTGNEIAFSGDYFRSVKNTNYLVTETNAQTIGWNSSIQFPPYPGQLRQNVFAHIGSGANMVEYWHWSSLHYGQETYWKGVLSHDLEPNRAYGEVTETAHDLKRFGKKLVNLKKENEVAILFSHDSNDGLNFMPFNGSGSAWTDSDGSAYRNQLVAQFHRVLYQNNVGVDFVFSERPNFDKYKLLIIPSLYIASDELLKKINTYIKNGGHVIMQFKSGFCDENSMVRPMLAPGPLREACGFYYQEFSNFKELSLKDNPFGVENNVNLAKDWMEFIIPETAKPLAFYDNPFFSKYPAVTINNFGKGTLLYQGSIFSDEIQTKIIKQELTRAGIESPDFNLSWPIIVKSGTNDYGNKVHFYYNYSSEDKELKYPHESGKELVSEKSVAKGEIIKILPWNVLIIEEK